MFVGRVAAADGLPAGELFANYKTTFDSQLNAGGEYGGAGADSQTPAVVQSGRCGDDDAAPPHDRP